MSKGAGKGHPGEGSLWCRYEIKYLISESRAAAIEQFLRPFVRLDRYCERHPTNSYPIVSLYLDSENLRLCQESLHGHKNRFKLRVRSYTDEPDYPRFVEIKRRANFVIIKNRTEIMRHNIPALASGMFSIGPSNGNGAAAETLKQFMLYKSSINARPIIQVRYMRRAFESLVDDRVRITFDRNLSYKVVSIPEVSLNGTGWQQTLLNYVIMEVKFTGYYPTWLNRMVKYFNLRQQSVSKYARSVKKACLLRFCAPEVLG
jgi:SPX domain protein involved in polyphosphate accumulation